MHKVIGWAAAWILFYMSGCVGIIMSSFGATWLSPTYSRLLDASDNARAWCGDGVLALGAGEQDEHAVYLGAGYSLCKGGYYRNENP